MARTKTNTRNDTKTLTTSWRNRHLDKLYFLCFFSSNTSSASVVAVLLFYKSIGTTRPIPPNRRWCSPLSDVFRLFYKCYINLNQSVYPMKTCVVSRYGNARVVTTSVTVTSAYKESGYKKHSVIRKWFSSLNL